MKKWKFKHLFLTLAATSTVAPLSLISASTTSEETNAQPDGNGSDTDVVEINAPDFDSFKKLVDKVQSEKLKEILDERIKKLRQRAKSYLDSTTNDTNNIIKANYYHKVAAFLEDNKAEIIKNPIKFGLPFFYPRIASTDKTLKNVSINFLDRTFDEVKVLSSDANDGTTIYAKDYPKDITDKIEVTSTKEEIDGEKPEVNKITKDELVKLVEKYYDEFNVNFEDIVINNEDTPNNKSTQYDYNSETRTLSMTVPSGFDSWEQYIKSKIASRVLYFDLTQNSKPDEEKEDQPKNPIFPPLLPDIVDPSVQNEEIQLIPNLKPYITATVYDRYNSDLNAFASEYNNNVATKGTSDTYFFFKNLVNTRFKYSVLKLTLTPNNELQAQVQIQDVLNPDKTKVYTEKVVKAESKQLALATNAAVNTSRKLFEQFYIAMGVGKHINYKLLPSQRIANSLFNIVSRTVYIFDNSEEFQKMFSEIIQRDQNTVSSAYDPLSNVSNSSAQPANDETNGATDEKLNNEKVSTNLGLSIANLILEKTLWGATINEIPYFTVIPNTLSTYYNDDLVTGFKNKLEIIKSNIAFFNDEISKLKDNEVSPISLLALDKALETLRTNINYLLGLVNVPTSDVYGRYITYNEVLSDVTRQIRNLFNILKMDSLDQIKESEPAKLEEYKNVLRDSFNNLEYTPYRQPQTSQKLLYILGSIFSIWGIILAAIVGIFISMRKKWKLTNIKNKTITISIISAVSIIAAIALFILGLGGLL
ncbi:hypothetical protein H9M94_01770 [Mycoplasma sp. Pen4]|uniref:MSC_0620 family F1-like ATPase-associated subunit n=1 Tax=Mycoplasma sp. Pen4 TaxID=640330 RepID=UPI00165492AC|nr:hypothetical protein [Mycoplasma sp. Pen4]QNM93340.1 hypothetical protein H9M94_01770 [Mycoplasma sp. Pen4]